MTLGITDFVKKLDFKILIKSSGFLMGVILNMSTSREYFLLIVESFGRIDISLELTTKISNYDIFFEIDLHVGLKTTCLTISLCTTCWRL